MFSSLKLIKVFIIICYEKKFFDNKKNRINVYY